MTIVNKTYSLLLCDLQLFLAIKNKIVKVQAASTEEALTTFISDFNDEIFNHKILVFCYEDEEQKYGYEYGMAESPE